MIQRLSAVCTVVALVVFILGDSAGAGGLVGAGLFLAVLDARGGL